MRAILALIIVLAAPLVADDVEWVPVMDYDDPYEGVDPEATYGDPADAPEGLPSEDVAEESWDPWNQSYRSEQEEEQDDTSDDDAYGDALQSVIEALEGVSTPSQ